MQHQGTRAQAKAIVSADRVVYGIELKKNVSIESNLNKKTLYLVHVHVHVHVYGHLQLKTNPVCPTWCKAQEHSL